AVTFTIDASASTVCSISGSTVSFIGNGTCVIDANQAGNANFYPAPQVQQSFGVKTAQTISFTSSPPANATVGGATYTVTATATSGLAVTFTIDASASTVCSISGSTVSFIGSGTCVIDANQAGNANFYPAPQVQQSFHVNQPPTLRISPPPQETFDTVGNVQFEFKATQTLSPGIFVSGNLVANFIDTDGPSPLSAVAFSGATTNGGTVTIATNGEFTFTPKAGDLAASDSFSYQVTDGAATVTRTVTINFKSRAWFVKNNAAAGGQGRSNDPFNTLAAAQTVSLAGDYIFVYGGDLTNTGQTAGFTLKANQKLYGEAYGLTVTPPTPVNGVSPVSLVAANTANRPVIDNTAANSDGILALNISGVEIRGVSVSGTQDAIDLTTNGTNSGGATITDNVIRQPGIDGIHVAAGGTGAVTLAISNNTITGNVRGMELLKTAGTMTITDFSNNVITATTPGSGVVIDGAIFDATPGNPINTVSGGTTVIGQSGTPVGAAGMSLTNVTGDLAFTDLDIFNNAGAGLRVTSTGALNAGAGTGFRLTVSSGVGSVDSNGGAAVDVSNASINLPLLTFLRSTNSTTNGVSLVNAFGGVGGTTLSASSGQIADPVGASGTAVNISGGNGNVTLGIPIINTSGNSVVVTGLTSNTVTFSGSISDTGSGISLTSNTGATISFTGTITASTGANPAFTATGGGTVTATDTSSTLTTTTGTALNVANTTIGAAGLKFKSISAGTAASGPTNGIVLNNTGISGGLTVAGTGAAGTGGTIQKTGAEGILLTNSANASFSWMAIQNPGTHGISSTGTNNLTIANTTFLDAAGNNAVDDGFHISNMLGTLNITNCTINGARHQGVTIDNLNTNMAALNMTGTTVQNTPGGDGMLMQMRGTSVLTTGTISGNTFSGNSATGLQVNNADTGNIQNLTVQTNTITGNNAGMDFDLSQASSMTINVLTNTLNNQHSTALNLDSASSTTGGTMTAKLMGNIIGTAGSLDSGSAIGAGVRVIIQRSTQGSITIDSNQIREVPNSSGIDVEAIGHTAGNSVKVKITNNTISRPTGTNTNIGCGTLAPCPLSTIFVLSDTDSAPETVCSSITGNSAYDPTSWAQGAGQAAYYLARRSGQALNLEGNTGLSPRNNILGNNTVTNLSSGDFIDESGNVTVVAVGTCGAFP
ncbi:MAG: cadherin-like domain-containing protein, partial [Thermoanaerobaculia bacterium]